MSRTKGFTLIELLVVIAIIAVLMGIIMPALSTAKKVASSAACLGNHRTLLTAWFLYADDYDGLLVNNRACYDTPDDRTPWVLRPKDAAGNDLIKPAPITITDQDRFRGIQAGSLWKYVQDVGAYRCPGDNRRSTRNPPRDCWRSYSISYAFGHVRTGTYGYRPYRRLTDIKNGAFYYVFLEEEHQGGNYGENEGGWHFRLDGGQNVLENPASYTFYDALASFHNKSSTFGFADGHAERQKWTDKRTLEFIASLGDDTSALSGAYVNSAGNEDLYWLIEHFIATERRE